jgi:hypothetical protein
MEKPKDDVRDEKERNSMKLEDLVSTVDTLVVEAGKLVEMELLPYLHKYIELGSDPRPESLVRSHDSRFLVLN